MSLSRNIYEIDLELKEKVRKFDVLLTCWANGEYCFVVGLVENFSEA